MKRKVLLSVLLVGLLAFGAGMGTLAYYSKTITSSNNIVRAAAFTVNSDGTLDENQEFDLSDQPLMPGGEGTVYNFSVDKKGTEVPVEYTVNITPYGTLFREGTPVELILERCINPEEPDHLKNWEIVTDTISPEFDLEKFRINWKWAHGDNDLAFQNDTGKVKIEVIATQINEGEPAIYADKVYTRDKDFGFDGNDPERYSDENVKLVFGNENGKRTLFIEGTTMFGDVYFEFNGNNGTLVSHELKKNGRDYEGTSNWLLGEVSNGYFSIKNDNIGEEKIFEITIPTGTALEWLGLE